MSTAKGRQAEERAARFLRRRGYEILDRNVRLGRGEIDIIARHGDIIAFVEVKCRRNRDDALLAMHKDKCQRIRSAVLAYLAHHPSLAALQCRFDLIILTPGRWLARIEHFRDVLR
jgi:putative endonuclease